jgi:phosphate-selective porin OprO/OprP
LEPHYSFTGRLTFTPLYENKGKQLLHLGVALSARDLGASDFRYRQRPEIHLADRYVDTGKFTADKVTLLGAEAAVILGRFSVQAEYMSASMDASDVNDPSFGGFYITASVFLTDDYRAYKQSDAAFDRIKPSANLFDEGGIGAIELLARYSHLDLNDADIEGGKEDNFTIGLNWYLNPYTRVMLDYVSADVKDVGKIGALMMRFQIDFKMK